MLRNPEEDDSRKDAKEAKFGEIILTPDSRRLSQIRIRTFHRRDAEYAEGKIFAQSGDGDWTKELVFKRAMFLFVVVSRQTKNEILCALCASAVNIFKESVSG
jgi:hypothetical protein